MITLDFYLLYPALAVELSTFLVEMFGDDAVVGGRVVVAGVVGIGVVVVVVGVSVVVVGVGVGAVGVWVGVVGVWGDVVCFSVVAA